MITIHRKYSFFNSFRKFEIYKNDRQIYKLKNNEKLEIEATEGDVIQAKLDWCNSNKITIKSNSSNYIILKSWLPSWLSVFLLIFIFSIFLINYIALSSSIIYIIFIPIFLVFLYMITLGSDKYLELYYF